MKNDTRLLFNKLLQQQARLNNIPDASVKFNVNPAVQQTLEQRIQESSEFLTHINFYGVTEQEGEKVGVGIGSTIASTTDTSAQDRLPQSIGTLDSNHYRCEQTNYDTAIKYQLLDQWAGHPNFQTLVRDARVQRIALDRMMIGFNGVSRAATSNRTVYPLLQDVNKGWLQQYRDNSPQRVMDDDGTNAGKVIIGNTQPYKNLDALVYDAINSLIEPWYRGDPQLVVITGRKLLSDKYFPLVNTSLDPTEQLAADLIISQKRLGNLPAVSVPYFPDNALFITRLNNLSIYYQKSARRLHIIDNPKRDRIETYESSNDAFVIEDYGCGALIENIELE